VKFKTALPYYIRSLQTLRRTKTGLKGIAGQYLIGRILKKPVLFEVDEKISFYVRTLMDIWTVKEVVIDHDYERYRKIKRGDVVVDVGGGIGDFAILAARKAKRVYVFECDADRIELIMMNSALHGVQNVKLIPKACASFKQLWSVVEEKRIDFLKVDCEGCEYELFKSDADLSQIKYIAMEVHKNAMLSLNSYHNLLTLLIKSGYSLKLINSKVHIYLLFLYAKAN
jgi:hypothetical protein